MDVIGGGRRVVWQNKSIKIWATVDYIECSSKYKQ